ncbi:MAG: FtsQ-type POTRA domain-containing protein [Acidobacteriales bacterium]|nr:FtsQ-type POTRA domain-containing protein [Terriglobales bacterium]
MARKSASTIAQDELYPPFEEPAGEELDDRRMLDLDVEQESPFLRGQKRVSARRGAIPKKAARGLLWSVVSVCLAGAALASAAALYNYGEHSWRFRVNSSDDIDIRGLDNVTRSQVLDVMGGDIGRNIFFIPLAERKKQLEQIPWVESASVMRFAPNRLRIEIHERTPVAFARVAYKILLTDAGGTLMDLPRAGKKKYSFPVILGINPGEPLSTRAARMKIYNDLLSQLDSGGAHYSQDLAEVDLSDLDDVKITASTPEGEILIHLGSANYLDRYKVYVTHLQEWRQQFAKLQSVDLRYDHQIVLNPDLQGAITPGPLPSAAARAAIAAGVKPAMLVTRGSGGPNVRSIIKPGVADGSVEASPSSENTKPQNVQRQRSNHKQATLRRTAGHRKTKLRSSGLKLSADSGSSPSPSHSNPPTTTIAAAKTPHQPAKKKPSPSISKGEDTP